jgi:hypothetical protein
MGHGHGLPEACPPVSVVIPTFDEAKNLPHVFALLSPNLHEAAVVDGRSLNTIESAQQLRPDVRILRQNGRGKGNAMACGFAAVTGDVVVRLDADGSADLREIPAFVDALEAGADSAKGTRFTHGDCSEDVTPTRAWGNRWLNHAVNLLFGTHFTNLCYGYAFSTHCLSVLELAAGRRGRGGRLWGEGFETETIINTRAAKAALAIAQVPSFDSRRRQGQSNLSTWPDGSSVLRALLVERLNRKGRATDPGIRSWATSRPPHSSSAPHTHSRPRPDRSRPRIGADSVPRRLLHAGALGHGPRVPRARATCVPRPPGLRRIPSPTERDDAPLS